LTVEDLEWGYPINQFNPHHIFVFITIQDLDTESTGFCWSFQCISGWYLPEEWYVLSYLVLLSDITICTLY